jgi:3-isopropylmalate/(R)-2-methylmalate dehydratase small subunit
MEPFHVVTGLVAPLDRANVDTDAIIPKQFLKSIKRSGFGVNLFDAWRYLDRGEPGMDNTRRPKNPDFVPTIATRARHPARAVASAAAAAATCAVTLGDYGFRVLIAPSRADIFSTIATRTACCPSCCQVRRRPAVRRGQGLPGFRLTVDLERQTVAATDGSMTFAFDVEPFRNCLYNILGGSATCRAPSMEQCVEAARTGRLA